MPEQSGQETISRELEQACAEEPIHIIGTIQPHGFTLVVDVATTRIVQVSSGVARHWAGLDQSTRLLQGLLATWVDGLDPDPAAQLRALPLTDPIALTLRPRVSAPGAAAGGRADGEPAMPAETFECIGHRVDGVAVLEWMPVGDVTKALTSRTDIIVAMRSAITRLRRSNALDVFFRECVQEVARLCAFDRVMIYRFRPDWSGEVVAEHAAANVATRFLGLRFPASDIPRQARALFTSNKVRVLADVLAEPDTLVPPRLPDGAALDQSHSLLRGFSEVHRSYLTNMGVRATMSLSILSEGKLWGLIACHHYQPRVPPHHVRDTLQHVCELVADFSALRIEALSQLDTAYGMASLEQLLSNVEQAMLHEKDLKRVLDRMLPQLLLAFDASAFYLRVGDQIYASDAGDPAAAAAVLEELAGLFDASVLPASVLHVADLLTPGSPPLLRLPHAAGLLAAQQSSDRREICAFTRPEIVKEVLWAGAPTKHLVTPADGRVRLEPRRSFAQWKERVSGTARRWQPSEVEACEQLLRILSDAGKRQVSVKLTGELEWRAHHDHLTGLYNRRTMEERLDRRMHAGSFDAALMLIDLDHFKMINDTHGHAVGDRLLKEFSFRLGAVIRPFDTLARMGGDEFMLLAKMPVPDPAVAMAMAGRLHRALEEPFAVGGQLLRIGISIGIAIPPGHGTNATDLMRRADLALYSAKKLGRSNTVLFDAELESTLLGTYELEQDLQEAIVKGQLSLVFQPQVNLASGRVVGLEALARWTHPVRGAIAPGVFIPIAERSTLITQIGEWVVRTAAATQADWRQQGRTSLPVAVNVSMKDVMSGRLVDNVSRALADFHLPAQCLEIELTESVVMSDLAQTRNVLSGLQKLGVSTSLDDFGTGYSSLSYLRQLPLTSLKVDQSFTAGLTDDAHCRSLTQAILKMAQALELTTIAEGVETQDQMRWLTSNDCRVGQGYLFSQPVAPEAVHGAIERIESGWRAMA